MGFLEELHTKGYSALHCHFDSRLTWEAVGLEFVMLTMLKAERHLLASFLC